MEKEKKSIKGGKWHGDRGANEQSGNFAKPILEGAILRSHILKVANIQFSRGHQGSSLGKASLVFFLGVVCVCVCVCS